MGPLKPAFIVMLFSAACAAAQNKVSNPGFEDDLSGWGWNSTAPGAQHALDRDVHFSGTRSLRIHNESKFQPHVYCRLAQVAGNLKPNTAYRIGVWCRGRDAGIATIGGGPGWFLRIPLPRGSFDWTRVEGLYLTGPGETAFELMVLCESPTDALWIDELSMVEDPSRTADLLKQRNERERRTRARIQALPGDLEQTLGRIRATLNGHPRVAADPYVNLHLAVARRFLQRVNNGRPTTRQSEAFTQLQLEETAGVLAEAEQLVRDSIEGRRSVADVRLPGAARPLLKDGAFWIDDGAGGSRPVYYTGYGHFGQIEKDLANFPTLGVTLVQDGRVGPSSMNPDGSPNADALNTIETAKKAAKQGIHVDFLTSPHYYPAWAQSDGAPHWTGNIDHPRVRQVVETWLRKMGDALRDEQGLLSFCLTNEPTYGGSGRDPVSRPQFDAFLKRRHGTIETLNKLYGTAHESFDKVPLPNGPWPVEVEQQRAFFDWYIFNQEHWAGHHRWMSDILHTAAPGVPTHAKIMVFFSLDRDKVGWGVDPELFCEATDLAGCDAYAFPGGADDWAWDWRGHAFWYDLLHSFRNQPVFNSENHLIPDGTPATHISPDHTYSIFWQGALHHQGATTAWVWEEESHPSLAGSIYFRPANIAAAGRAMLDLNRFSREVRAVESAPARVALLYSMPSAIWEPSYKSAMFAAYTAITCLGQPVTFISEKQLAAGETRGIQYILIPQATHVTRATMTALANFKGKIIAIGDDCLRFDEYHRPHNIPDTLKNAPAVAWIDDENIMSRLLRFELKRQGLGFHEIVLAGTTTPAFGVEYRVVRHEGRTLVPLINHRSQAQTIHLKLPGSGRDLLTGRDVDLKNVTLAPMRPMMLQVQNGDRK